MTGAGVVPTLLGLYQVWWQHPGTVGWGWVGSWRGPGDLEMPQGIWGDIEMPWGPEDDLGDSEILWGPGRCPEGCGGT